MKINLYMIKEDILDFPCESHLLSDPWEFALQYPAYCPGPLRQPEQGTLYILRSANLPKQTDKKFSFICIGQPPEKWFRSSCDFLWVDAESSPENLVNRINEIFYSYTAWGDSLQEIVDEQLPALEFGTRSAGIVGNAIYAQGAGYRPIFAYYPKRENETPEQRDNRQAYESLNLPGMAGNPLDAEVIDALFFDEEYNNAIYAENPSIFSGKNFGFRSLYYNIRIQNVAVARITFDEVIRPFTGKDYATIKILGDYLGKSLSLGHYFQFDRAVLMDYVLENLLLHKLLPDETIDDFLSSLGWRGDETFTCMVLQTKIEKDASDALPVIALSLSAQFHSECYTIFKDAIVFVFNMTRLKTDNKKLLSDMLPKLRDRLLTASVSSSFRSFKNLYYYYTQAIIAQEIGRKKNPTRWYFRFEDYHLDYLIYRCTKNTPPESLIPEGLYRLLEHDSEKGSDYMNLLRTYLMNERNIAKTTRNAFLHRNTFLYRIQKIGELLQMDLDDPDTRTTLLLAYYILKENNIESERQKP